MAGEMPGDGSFALAASISQPPVGKAGTFIEMSEVEKRWRQQFGWMFSKFGICLEDSSCRAGPTAAPRGITSPHEAWEPREQSGCAENADFV